MYVQFLVCISIILFLRILLNVQEVPDPDILVTFPLVDDEEGVALVAWTTTPWTLPSNLALCVNKNFVYVKVRFWHYQKVPDT